MRFSPVVKIGGTIMAELSTGVRKLIVGAETKVPLLNGDYVTAINLDNAATTPPLLARTAGSNDAFQRNP